MKKSWKLTQKILAKEKTIESRWYKSKHSPWDNIKAGETVYFKDSGDHVRIKAEVEKVIQFSNLNPKKIKEILYKYGKDLGITNIPKFVKFFKHKKYCILIFLRNPQKIKPFGIDKTGFGIMSAWITVDDINRIKKLSKGVYKPKNTPLL